MGKLKVFLGIIIALAILGAGAIYYFEIDVLGFESGKDKGTSAQDLADLSINTDIITTNLASSGNFAIVQFNILLSTKEAKEETEKRTPEVRAAIISTIAGITKDQLIGEGGIVILEQELSTRLSGIVETGKIERVLVTEFKVQ
ncbi:flagellar basal body-associated FliL family protein [Paenisporosarcina sp. TG-14]|uniref:flagellar basal body-associated FliL family protein n=1 Tax=Paenisporosarcina sp. TG-14 TaxID=1231057 RepID=UPI00031C229B|nr:flagellar basal body-associated FliL family protein [Paenisporosarcina sp. TG-14]